MCPSRWRPILQLCERRVSSLTSCSCTFYPYVWHWCCYSGVTKTYNRICQTSFRSALLSANIARVSVHIGVRFCCSRSWCEIVLLSPERFRQFPGKSRAKLENVINCWQARARVVRCNCDEGDDDGDILYHSRMKLAWDFPLLNLTHCSNR